MEITIETLVNAPLQKVWDAWVTPQDICSWNFASDDWACPTAVIDLSVGGKFSYRMEARDGSMGFDFEGTFTQLQQHRLIEYEMTDNRKVSVEFQETPAGIRVVETFDAEDAHTAEQQRQGWQCILNNFKEYAESKST